MDIEMDLDLDMDQELAALDRQVRAEGAALAALRTDVTEWEERSGATRRGLIDPTYLAGMVLTLPVAYAAMALYDWVTRP